MEFVSRLIDQRINSENILIETTIGEYLEVAQKIIKNNNLQRKRVNSSKSVYSLLRDDLIKGCIIPPLTLAVTSDSKFETGKKLADYIKKHPEYVLILDGLQRTYTMLSASELLREKDNKDSQKKFARQKLRLEIYIGINKFGILYRMLTLNTGQTRMTTRHQIEILYGSVIDKEAIELNDGSKLKLVTEKEGRVTKSYKEFKFNDVIEGFTSYIQRDELPIDRQDILEYIDMLATLQNENPQSDLFKDFAVSYCSLIVRLQELFGEEDITNEDVNDYVGTEKSIRIFGRNIVKVFNTPQAMCGFGAAIGRLKDLGIVSSFEELTNGFAKIVPDSDNSNEWLIVLLIKLDDISNRAKKIGNEQRMFFQYFFRELFNDTGDSYLQLTKAVTSGYQKLKSQV